MKTNRWNCGSGLNMNYTENGGDVPAWVISAAGMVQFHTVSGTQCAYSSLWEFNIAMENTENQHRSINHQWAISVDMFNFPEAIQN
jgi:hypothetical protein